MDGNIEVRKKQLQSLKQYITSSEDNLKAVFHSLGWSMQKTYEEHGSRVICSLNKHHLISEAGVQEHLKRCKLKTNGYQEDELFLSELTTNNSDSFVKLTAEKKIEILTAAKVGKSDFRTAWNGKDEDPLTSNRLSSTFSADERLALYDYSIKHTKGPPKPQEFTLELPNAIDKKEISDKERLELERNAKRRRTKYKSVHTSKKSQTEITRELINNQMALYEDWLKQKQEQEDKEKERLKRLAKEKIKTKMKDTNRYNKNQHHYSYDHNEGADQDWNQSNEYSYSAAQYYGTVNTEQGIITDWSHVYQGVDPDLYSNSEQYQPDESQLQTQYIDNLGYPNLISNNLDQNADNYDSINSQESTKEHNRYEVERREKSMVETSKHEKVGIFSQGRQKTDNCTFPQLRK